MAVLNGLNEIDWVELRHARGSASDVPRHLNALTSAEPEVSSTAIGLLAAALVQNGDRYEASAAAVPFLITMITETRTPHRATIVTLLARLAIGSDRRWLPAGLPIARQRADLADLLAIDLDEELRRMTAHFADNELDLPAPLVSETSHVEDLNRRTRQQWAMQTYDAVRSGVEVFTDLLTDADPAVRRASAYMLAWLPEDAERILPCLADLTARETEPATMATAVISIGLLVGSGQLDPADRRRWLPDDLLMRPHSLVRTAGAIATARLEADGTDFAVVRALAAAVREQSVVPDGQVPFMDGDLAGLAAIALAGLGPLAAPHLVAAVVESLPRANSPRTIALLSALLSATFAEEPVPEGTPFSLLNPVQQFVVNTVATAGNGLARHRGGSSRDLCSLVAAYGLPYDLGSLRKYTNGL